MDNLIDTFANRLSKALTIRNIKPIELAEKSGIDKAKISSYVNGRYKANQNTLYILAKTLDVDPAWLMGYDVPMNKTNSTLIKEKDEADTPEIRAIARDVAKLKPEKKELFINLLKQMSVEADEASKR